MAEQQCSCVTKINGMLAEHNAELVTNLFGNPRTVVATCKANTKKRGKQPMLMAAFCPFCGEKYTPSEPSQ